jgi:hypothetical protein
MIVTDLNNFWSQANTYTGIGIRFAELTKRFMTSNKAFLSSLFSSEYFGKKRSLDGLYVSLNALNHIYMALFFMNEEVTILRNNNEEYDIEEIKEKYSIDCLIKYIRCHTNIDIYKMIDDEIRIINSDDDYFSEELGISTMVISTTFIID